MGAAASDYFTPYADIQHGFLDAELGIENLHELAAKGKYHHVSMHLKKGMDPNGKMFPEDDEYEREDTPMICAARGHLWNKGRKRHLKTLDVLLKFGANVNHCNALEQTPLYVACDRNLVVIANWLVTHGADVNRANKFPVLLDEIAAIESLNQAADNNRDTPDSDESDESDDEDEKAALEAQQQFAKLVQDELHKHVQQQASVRGQLLKEIEDAQRIDDQRVYREKLGEQGAKRKEKRRKLREQLNYEKYMAKIERKRLEQAFPLMNPSLEANNNTNSQRRPSTAATTGSAGVAPQPPLPELLAWEKAAVPRKGGRPKWTSCEVWTNQQHQNSTSSGHEDRSEVLLTQCQRMYDSLQVASQRKKQQRQQQQLGLANQGDGNVRLALCVVWREQLGKFLKFFRSRLKTHLENVEADFEDTRSDRLSSDDVYSQKDIKEALQSLCFAVKANVRSELQDTINMMALLLRQVFSEAEVQKLVLELDIGSVEDRDLLARVERLSVVEWVDAENGGSATVGVLNNTTSSAKKPQALSSSDSPSKEQLLRQAQKDHEDEIRAALHTSKLRDEAHTKEAKKLQRKLADAREQIEELERAVEETQQHIAQTKQFQAMKLMVTKKNDQLRAMRTRLLRYEPNYCDDDGETKNADDDDDDE